MAKRKYEEQPKDTAKKAKQEAETEVVTPTPESATTKDSLPQQSFSVKQFRKELASKTGLTIALSQFLQVCTNPDNKIDYVLEYLKAGGNSHEILRQVNQESKKNITLATPAFHLFHLIIMKVQSDLPHMISITEEACRFFLNTFMPTVEIMISENSGPRHRKIILKLFTSMVTLNPDLGVEILNQAPLTPQHLRYIAEKGNYKEKDNVRTAFVHFMTSFLVDGHLPLIKALLEKQGLLSLVIPGLVYDEGEAVLIFLNILKKNVIENMQLSKSLKLRTFSHHVLHNIFQLYHWKGPNESNHEYKSEYQPLINELLAEIILTLFTSHKTGLYFVDQSLGTGEINKNPNLYTALLTLKRPWENKQQAEVLLEIVFRCPDLHRALISLIEPCFEPQHSRIFDNAVKFLIQMLNKMRPEALIDRLSELNNVQMGNFVRFTTLPVRLLKHLKDNFSKSDTTLTAICVKVLVKMLSTFKKYLNVIETVKSQNIVIDIKNRIEGFVPKHFPPTSALVTIINKIIKGEKDDTTSFDYKLPEYNDTECLIEVIDLLLLYNEVNPSLLENVEENLELKEVLDYTLGRNNEMINILKFKVLSLWLLLEPAAVSLQNEMFKELLLILLEVFINDETCIWNDAKPTLKNFLINSSLFDTNEHEIDVMLYALRKAKVEPVSVLTGVFDFILENMPQLKTTITDQMSQIDDNDSSVNWSKVFEELSENKKPNDALVTRNNLPSPFLVGCLQYVKINKMYKPNLKRFISFYVANVLHLNGSPERVKLFLMPYKFDAKAYVSGWLDAPMEFNEIAEDPDLKLNKICNNILSNGNMKVTEIFDEIEEVSKRDDGHSYKIQVKLNDDILVDSTELIALGSCLTFYILQLSKLKKLEPEKEEIVQLYFDCIIEIARQNHLSDVYKSIIMNVFTNTNLMQVYSAHGGDKHQNGTNFILHIIKNYKHIIDQLEMSHKVMIPLRLKNEQDILKMLKRMSRSKIVDTHITKSILEVVGLTLEGMNNVLTRILDLDFKDWVKDSKEPSFICDILTCLVKEYSKNADIHLSESHFVNIIEAYTQIITKSETYANFEDFENALNLYFQMSPNTIKLVPARCFERFFQCKNVRKSTTQLASTMIKESCDFCEIFKIKLQNEEVLKYRELVLPLANAILKQSKYVVKKEDFWEPIYLEYKPNILKYLEKPHKTGQIYINNWILIRKLILECMEVTDCEKYYDKVIKFENVTAEHVCLMSAVFLKIFLAEKPVKTQVITNFLTMLSNLISMALKESMNIENLNEIVTVAYHTVKAIQVQKCNHTSGWDFHGFAESSAWQSLCRSILKDSLKIKTANSSESVGPKLINLLSNLVDLICSESDESVTTLFDMVTSHSEFLNIMLSHHSIEIKSRLVEFLFVLIKKNKSIIKTQQIPLYLSSYHASRRPCDRLILTILRHYESSGIPMNEYKPYLWGDMAANHYAVRKSKTSSLWAHPTPNQIMNLLDKETIDNTVKYFPVTQKLNGAFELNEIDMSASVTDFDGSPKSLLDKLADEGILDFTANTKDVENRLKIIILKTKYAKVIDHLKDVEMSSTIVMNDDDQTIYDPSFLLPLLSHLLIPGSIASSFKILRSGLLSVPVMALSSHCPAMREAAYHVLHRFFMLLETETKHKNDKILLTDFLETLRQSLPTAIVTEPKEKDDTNTPKNPRLPAVAALFLAKGLMASTAPFDPLYKPVNNFLIAKQQIDLTVVPDFLSLFHDNEVESSERRLWILDIIKDGVKTMADVTVIFKTMCLKMIMDYYSSCFCDKKTKDRILCVLCKLVTVPRAAEILIDGYGLMPWLNYAIINNNEDKSVSKSLVMLVHNLYYSLAVNSLTKVSGNFKKTQEESVLMIPSLRIGKDVELQLKGLMLDLWKVCSREEIEEWVGKSSYFYKNVVNGLKTAT